ncbi:glycolate oxidase FAD binding subunit [Nitrosomonas sp. PY1]|uniref:glycolate oxidase subunit GlcE n=1 Tax=Nitrosomonas sp. PY1 TaxID=1803906 RepID=UPI001FC88898|nr:glycolate oxidase subunit GlcE [Nitrosomonas sp. PY1]GKS70176.1 glycolate oxidase FAD binding subunit [Nitrosomonas sp. PY1]
MQDVIDSYRETIRTAAENKTPLHICGGNTKQFYGNTVSSQPTITLDTKTCNGIVDYDPAELVVTARAGTRLSELEAVLEQQGQMLPFEPPHFGQSATLGGCVAVGLSGPRRATTGSVRDFVLGVRMLNGKGEDLRFGGQVMKNVAGYDVSRLMVGAMGTLGMLLEISLKVLPKPAVEMTVCLSASETAAIDKMNRWAGQSLPISATCYRNGKFFFRLSGVESAVKAAWLKLGGEKLQDEEGSLFWRSIREQTSDFFQIDKSKKLWRLSIASNTAPLLLTGEQLMEWNGSLRWLVCDSEGDDRLIYQTAENAGGHATLFRGHSARNGVFHSLSPAILKIHRALKEKFDPAGILNPGRFYPEL